MKPTQFRRLLFAVDIAVQIERKPDSSVDRLRSSEADVGCARGRYVQEL
jgi:hypothetical protein